MHHACERCQCCTAEDFVIMVICLYATNWAKLNKLGRVQLTELTVCEQVADKSETCRRLVGDVSDKFSPQDLSETWSRTSLRQDRCYGIWVVLNSLSRGLHDILFYENFTLSQIIKLMGHSCANVRLWLSLIHI